MLGFHVPIFFRSAWGTAKPLHAQVAEQKATLVDHGLKYFQVVAANNYLECLDV